MTARPGAAAPLAAIFVVDRSNFSRAMMRGWLAAGNRIAAVVTPAGGGRRVRSGAAGFLRRMSRLLSFRQRLERKGVPVLDIAGNADWLALIPRLAAMRADLLICFAFPRKIPDALLALVPLGGVNLHPALLPACRGPNPIHRMLIDGTQDRHGGVTLHRMSAEFDAGEILARIRFGKEDWASFGAFQNALTGAMERLVVAAAPLLASGSLRGEAQDADAATWASVESKSLVVSPDWTADYLERLCAFLYNSPGVSVEAAGRFVPLAPPLTRIGPATGAPAPASRGTVDFDLADGRVRCRIRTKSARRLARMRVQLDRRRHPASFRPIDYCGLES